MSWVDHVRRNVPFVWQDIVYPVRIRKNESLDVGAFVAVVIFVLIVAFGLYSVSPLFARIADWFTSTFTF